MRVLTILLLVSTLCSAAERKAKNVILFLADAGGIPTLHAASVHGYGGTRKLYVQSMPNIGLSDTSTASNWVTDSAAGMMAIVTGHKTHNGVLSQSDAAVRGKADGAPLKTILEYAEQRGLSTGVITNTAFYDATPAACYAQANDRRATAKIAGEGLPGQHAHLPNHDGRLRLEAGPVEGGAAAPATKAPGGLQSVNRSATVSLCPGRA
jgi:alkaline phosphatase